MPNPVIVRRLYKQDVQNGLLNNLVHYYEMKVAGGNNAYTDIGFSNNLIPMSGLNGGSGQTTVTGHVNATATQMAKTGSSCDGISTVAFVPVDYTGDGSGNTSMSYCCWFNLLPFANQDFKSAFGAPIMGIVGGIASRQCFLLRQTAANQIQWACTGQGGGTSNSVTINGVTDSQWHLAVMGFDQPNGQVWLSIDNGARQNAALATFNSLNGLEPFTAMLWNVACNDTFGIISDIGIWNNRVFTAANRASLWNGGAGLPFSRFTR